MGSRDAGAIQDLPWDPSVLAGPHPPTLDTPLLVAPESPVWTLRFLLQRVHHRLLRGGGGGRWVWVDEGGLVHLDKALRLGVATGFGGEERGGGAPPPPGNGGEDV